MSRRQKPYELKLGRVGILILVYHDVAEPVLIGSQYLRVRLKKLYGLHNQIVKIQSVVFLKGFLILSVSFCNSASVIVETVLHLIFLRIDQLVLGRRNSI